MFKELLSKFNSLNINSIFIIIFIFLDIIIFIFLIIILIKIKRIHNYHKTFSEFIKTFSPHIHYLDSIKVSREVLPNKILEYIKEKKKGFVLSREVLPNKILEYIKAKKKGFILNLLFFIFLIITLILRKYYPYLFVYSILEVYFFFLFSQYYDFENRIYIIYALILLIFCPFLLIFNQDLIAENFASYVYGFLCLGVLGFFIDNLREKSRNRGKLKIYKFLITFFVSLLIAFTIFFYFNNVFISFRDLQLSYLKNTNEQKYFSEYYKSFDKIFVNGKFVNNKVWMNITFPDKKAKFLDNIYVEGWALDKNSKENSGIDKVEFWLDGKPGLGAFLGNANLGIQVNNIISNSVGEQFKNCGFNGDIKIENISSGSHRLYVYAHSNLFGWIYKEINIETIKDFSNKNKIAEAELYDKDIKIYIDKQTDQQIINNSFEIEGWVLDVNSSLNSNNPGIDKIEIWLDGYPGIGRLLVEGNLNKERSDLVPVFGQQFLKAGYLYKVDINDLGKGKHIIFVFAHSIYSGWRFESFRIEVK